MLGKKKRQAVFKWGVQREKKAQNKTERKWTEDRDDSGNHFITGVLSESHCSAHFCQLFGGGGASCWVPSSGCQYGKIWGNAKWAVLHEKQLIGTNFPSWIFFFFPFFPSNHWRCIEVEMPRNCRPAGNCFHFFHWVTQQSASRL